MTSSKKLMLAIGAVLAGGAANAQISPYPAAGSDIVLFVSDLTNNTAMYQDLGVSINSLGVSIASVTADNTAMNFYNAFGTGTPGPMNGGGSGAISVGAGIIVGGVDLAVQAFTSGHTSDQLVYGFLAAGSGDGSTGVGQARF